MPVSNKRWLIIPPATSQLSLSLHQLENFTHLPETHPRLPVDEPVPALRPEAALKCGDGDPLGRGADAIADPCEIGERSGAFNDPDRSPTPARLGRRRLGPESDPGAGKTCPIE